MKMAPMMPATQTRVVTIPETMSRAPPETMLLPVTKETSSFSWTSQAPMPMTIKAMTYTKVYIQNHYLCQGLDK